MACGDDGNGGFRLRGAVLTGGASRRMGRDKALIEIDGRAMAVIVAATLVEAGCEPVVAVGGDAEQLTGLGLAFVPDVEPGAGPLGGVVGALEWFATDRRAGDRPDDRPDDWVIVVACDLPLLTVQTLEPLVAHARRERAGDRGGDVVVARTDRLEPALAIWRLAAHDRVRAVFDQGERSLHGAIDELRSTEVAVAPAALRNMNTPSDLPDPQ